MNAAEAKTISLSHPQRIKEQALADCIDFIKEGSINGTTKVTMIVADSRHSLFCVEKLRELGYTVSEKNGTLTIDWTNA